MFKALHSAHRDENGFTMAELMYILVAVASGLLFTYLAYLQPKSVHDAAVDAGSALSADVTSLLAGYSNYGDTSGVITVSGTTLIVAMGANPTPPITPVTKPVAAPEGAAVAGNLPAGPQGSPKFCFTVTPGKQDPIVFTESGHQPDATTCAAGVAS